MGERGNSLPPQPIGDSMKCPNCGKEVSKVRIRYENGVSVSGCRNCIEQLAKPMIIDDSMGFRIGVGHRNDIRRRKLAPDGSVYRDYGKRYFI